jgi:UDP-glucuronate 4-epimerase
MTTAPSKFLVTGAAGFIGFHQSKRLLEDGHQVIGLDNLNDYYDVNLKKSRLEMLQKYENFQFSLMDLKDSQSVFDLFEKSQFDCVINLAAQAGVRHSLEKPMDYVDSNLIGFMNILEGCRHHGVGHLLYASSSSVYGSNTAMPFSVGDTVDHPVSLYAATKKSNELMAHSYAHLYGLPVTGLRFFTVYGPWGRPDMALFIFVKKILEGEAIDVNNRGDMKRDFTYVDDIVEGITRLTRHLPVPDPEWNSDKPNPGTSASPYRLYNIGNNKPVGLLDFIKRIEEAIGREAKTNLRPMQMGDVKETYANIDALSSEVGFRPETPLKEGIERFVSWYREYYLKA